MSCNFRKKPSYKFIYSTLHSRSENPIHPPSIYNSAKLDIPTPPICIYSSAECIGINQSINGDILMRNIYNIICISLAALIKAIGTLCVAAETEANDAFPEAAAKMEAELAKATKAKKLP